MELIAQKGQQETFTHFLVLVGYRNGFGRDFTIELK